MERRLDSGTCIYFLEDGKVITLSATLIGDPEQAYAMYRTINLDP